MRHASPLFFVILITILFLIDIYAFRGIRILSAQWQFWLRIGLYVLFWLVPVTIVACIFYVSRNLSVVTTTPQLRVLYFLIGVFVLFYIPKLVFLVFQLGNDLVRISGHILGILARNKPVAKAIGEGMSRSEFLLKVGLGVAAIPFTSILYGILIGKYNYQVKKVKLAFKNLPANFDGYRILQVSDWHIGSFLGRNDKIQDAVKLINEQRADIILFTGDIVNNVATELESFVDDLKNLTAPDGVYSILGNHDYGEYVPWPSEESHHENMEYLFRLQKDAGFRLLRNESFEVARGDEKIGIAGVENWGLPPFPQYGDLKMALEPIKDHPFKVLMSHDPSHWDAEVLGKTGIDLTLSGHTHGMQMGINIPGLKWSPVQWKYPRWSGLYQEENQYLYVNVGIGYLAFPGRVGFLPEITVFELVREA